MILNFDAWREKKTTDKLSEIQKLDKKKKYMIHVSG